MSGKLTARSAASFAKRKGRYLDGGGLFLRVIDPGKRAYWVYRFRLNGVDREMSLGSFSTLSLADARDKHKLMVAEVAKKIDPVSAKRNAKTVTILSGGAKPTFGVMADRYHASHEGAWSNSKHARQWRRTILAYCGPMLDKPINEITTDDILKVLEPIWSKKPETASRIRGRIEVVIGMARALGYIDANLANPARWRDHFDKLLPSPKKVGKPRGHHAFMPHVDVPAFMARLMEIDSTASRALQFTILTAARSGETLRMTWDEVDPIKALWTIPEGRMKMKKEHEVPLSDAALDILRVQEAEHDRNPYVFQGARPRQPLSAMSMSLMLKRMGVKVTVRGVDIEATVHGFRSSFRTWAGETGVVFEIAEYCLAHAVGNAASQSYNQTTLLNLRRKVMSDWANYICGDPASNVIPLRAVTA